MAFIVYILVSNHETSDPEDETLLQRRNDQGASVYIHTPITSIRMSRGDKTSKYLHPHTSITSLTYIYTSITYTVKTPTYIYYLSGITPMVLTKLFEDFFKQVTFIRICSWFLILFINMIMTSKKRLNTDILITI